MTDTQSQTRQRNADRDTTEAPNEDTVTTDPAVLTNQIEQLAAENSRLRESLKGTGYKQYRGTARGLIAVGLLCGAAGFATTRSDVLFALAGIGLFSGVLTYYLTPERIVSAESATNIYAAVARSYEEMCADLGLSDRRLYVPVDSAEPEDSVRLFVPQHSTMAIPTASALQTNSFVADTQSGICGLSVHPTGGGLFEAFQTVLNGPLKCDPNAAAEQLSDAVVEEFELARSVTTTVDSSGETLSVRFTDPVYECRSGFDHPLVSFFAVGLAVALDTPVDATVTDTDPLSVTLHVESDETAADTDTVDPQKPAAARLSAGAG